MPREFRGLLKNKLGWGSYHLSWNCWTHFPPFRYQTSFPLPPLVWNLKSGECTMWWLRAVFSDSICIGSQPTSSRVTWRAMGSMWLALARKCSIPLGRLCGGNQELMDNMLSTNSFTKVCCSFCCMFSFCVLALSTIVCCALLGAAKTFVEKYQSDSFWPRSHCT